MSYLKEIADTEYVAVHCSYFGDNYGDTLFVIETVNYLVQNGVPRDNIVLPFASKRVLEQVGVSKTGLFNLIKCKYVIFSGGGYFGEPGTGVFKWNLRFLLRHGLAIFMTGIFGKKTIVSGVGVGPISFSFNRKVIKWFFNKASFVSVRDTDSYNFCINRLGLSNCILSTDAIIYPTNKISFKRLDRDKKVIGVHLPMLNDSKTLEEISISLKKAQDSFGYEFILFLDFYKPSFVNPIEKHFSNLDVQYKTYSYDGANELTKFLSGLDAVLTTKLHVGIVTTSLGLPAFSLYVHDKTPKYYKLINKLSWCSKFEDFNPVQLYCFFDFINNNENFSISDEVVGKSKLNYDLIGKWGQL